MPIIPSLPAVLNLLFQLSFFVPLLLLGAIVVRHPLKGREAVIALLVTFACQALILVRLVGIIPGYEQVEWNWGGKLASLIGTLVAIRIVGLNFPETGIRPGEKRSVPAALSVGLLLCVCSWTYFYFIGSGTRPPNMETLLFQATMPGLQEELFFRALLPILLDRALPGRSWRVLGVDFSVGMFIATIWFGLGHGVGLAEGEIQGSLQAVLTTGLTGFVLAWIYLRTRSLVLPIIFHNVVNLGLVWLLPAIRG